MTARTRILPIVIIAGLGLGAVALIPAHETPNSANAAEAATESPPSLASPSPELLRTLDEALRPPAAPAANSAPSREQVAAIDPVQSAAPSIPPQTVAPPEASAEPDGRIGSSAVNLRSGPSTSSSRLTVLQAGEAVSVDGTNSGWVHVTTPDGRAGWIYGRYLATGSDGAPSMAAPNPPAPKVAAASPTAAPRAVVEGTARQLTNRTARVAATLVAQSRPADGAPSVFRLRPGERVRISEVRGDWMRVETADGSSGWIRRAN